MLRFPCYEMSLPILPGMSGGPVFDETGHLRGVICSSVEPEDVPSYASVLWPAMGLQEPSQPDPAPRLLDLAKAGIVKAIGIALAQTWAHDAEPEVQRWAQDLVSDLTKHIERVKTEEEEEEL